MSDAAQIPILLDADTGYGNFNNARRLVHKLEKIGVAGKRINGEKTPRICYMTSKLDFDSLGCCLEDKLFPKTNSLLDDRQQPLADVDEFSLKIKVRIPLFLDSVNFYHQN